METANDRLKQARISAGYSSAEKAANAVGVSGSTYRAHENGQNDYNAGEAKRYAKKFKTTAAWLLTGDGKPTQVEATPEYAQIPEYDVMVSAGGGSMVEYENVKQQWPFNPAYLERELGINPERCVLLEVRGDSMEPTLSSGDRVMVNLNDTSFTQPGIFVLFDGDGTVVKRLDKVYGQDKIMLISDNDRYNNPYEVPTETINVVGRVIWAAKRF